MTVKKIREIDARLAELKSLKDELSTLAASCDGDHRSHCPILNALSQGDFYQIARNVNRRDFMTAGDVSFTKIWQHAEAQTHACGCQALTHEGEACALARHVAICENPTASITANARKVQGRSLIFIIFSNLADIAAIGA